MKWYPECGMFVKLCFIALQGSVTAMTVFFPLDTARIRLQGQLFFSCIIYSVFLSEKMVFDIDLLCSLIICVTGIFFVLYINIVKL